MKYLKLLLCTSFFLSTVNAIAQCVSCTVVISTGDNFDHVIPAGTSFCITATGSLSGHITITGGSLCNEGTIDCPNVLVNNGGSFQNFGVAIIDSLLITGNGSYLYNNGSITNERFAVTDAATMDNSTTMTVDFWGDSLSNMRNDGNIFVHRDFSNGYFSSFTNYGYMRIDSNFYNSTDSWFATECMINVGGDWYNSATVVGPASSSCGGFRIEGYSVNSGTIGSTAQRIDICDAGNAFNFVDVNSGIIISNSTSCECTHDCAAVGIAENEIETISIYPDPVIEYFEIRSESVSFDEVLIYDVIGSLCKVNLKKTKHGASVNASLLTPGIYFLKIRSGEKIFTSSFTKE